MPPKGGRGGSASAAAAPAGGGQQKISKLERSVMLAWLAKAENRNIIAGAILLLLLCYVSPALTGSAGSAKQGGGMASNKLVTTKEQGFQMMATYVNEQAGCIWTRVQCEGKYRSDPAAFPVGRAVERCSGIGRATSRKRRCTLRDLVSALMSMI